MTTPVMDAAKRHILEIIERNNSNPGLFAADTMALQIAVSAIDKCIKAEAAEAAARRAEAEFDAAMAKLFYGKPEADHG